MQYDAVMTTIYIDHVTTPKDNNFILYANDKIESQDGNTYLLMQSDGNLVLYTRTDASSSYTAPWASNTIPEAAGGYAGVQWDGNFVVYGSGSVHWNSGSWTNADGAPNVLVVSNGGYAYIVTSKNNVIWQINNAGSITPSLSSLDPKCTFPVLSIDHDSGIDGKYFNFDRNNVNIILGSNNDWNAQNFTVYNQRTQQLNKVVLWDAINGGSIGDGHGRKQPFDKAVGGDWQTNDILTFMSIPCYTPSPTKTPTAITLSPTLYTNAPTLYTMTPSANTKTPTFMPSKYPTNIPTNMPSILPTNIPTNIPSVPPTYMPSKYPTNIPSQSPTEQPTNIPSKPPTEQPTFIPSTLPTQRPTNIPTNIPTKSPIKDGEAIDATERSSDTESTVNGAGNNIASSDDTKTHWLIIIILSIAAFLMCILCVFIAICHCKKKKKKEADKEKWSKSKQVEMNEVHRVMSVSSINDGGTTPNVLTTSPMTVNYSNGYVDGEGFEEIDDTGNLPIERNEDDSIDDIFLDDAEPENVTAGFEKNTAGNNTDTDDEDNHAMYTKPKANVVTKGMED